MLEQNTWMADQRQGIELETENDGNRMARLRSILVFLQHVGGCIGP